MINRLITYIFLSLIVSLSLLSSGCSSTPEPKIIEQESPVVERQSVEVETEFQNEPPPKDYTVGPNDILFINVSGKREFSSTLGQNFQNLKGSRIDGNGNIHLPIVGSVAVSGLTLDQVETKLKEAFSTYIKDPWIVAEVTDYKSKPLYLIGQFKNPGTYYMERPLNILQGIALGDGLNDPSANLRGARVLRNSKIAIVDLYRLLMEGDMSQNIWLQPGDSIYVPDERDQNVFVFGKVLKPGPVPMINGRLTLLDALATAQFDEKASYSKDIRIIRSYSPTRGELIVVDLDKMLTGNMLPYNLMDGDVVYVASNWIGDWNKAINEMLPTLQAVSAILEPFVQIKYLSQ